MRNSVRSGGPQGTQGQSGTPLPCPHLGWLPDCLEVAAVPRWAALGIVSSCGCILLKGKRKPGPLGSLTGAGWALTRGPVALGAAKVLSPDCPLEPSGQLFQNWSPGPSEASKPRAAAVILGLLRLSPEWTKSHRTLA